VSKDTTTAKIINAISTKYFLHIISQTERLVSSKAPGLVAKRNNEIRMDDQISNKKRFFIVPSFLLKYATRSATIAVIVKTKKKCMVRGDHGTRYHSTKRPPSDMSAQSPAQHHCQCRIDDEHPVEGFFLFVHSLLVLLFNGTQITQIIYYCR